jgi:DNA-binding GntR family transcriptional regulator
MRVAKVADRRTDAALRELKDNYDRQLEALKGQDPDWVKELLDRLN